MKPKETKDKADKANEPAHLSHPQRTAIAMIKRHMADLDEKVNAAVRERQAFAQQVSGILAMEQPTGRKRTRRALSAATRQKLSDAKKKYWADRK